MAGWFGRKRLLACGLTALAAVGMNGCNKQKKTDEGKTYTSDSQGKQGAGASGGSQSDAKPLNAPADTTNGKSSKASDSGTSDATRGQVVAEPGAPVEHDPQQKPPSTPKPAPPGGQP